ncbi:hypothetical protein Pfo_012894 [Paulownia fortunei]|nr:hypothetical protein Pfo_012894 [Paulownia fortunei]
MASSAKQFSFFLLLTLLSSLHTHARDSQFFNKVPSTTSNNVVPNNKEAPNNQQEQQDPSFLPESENGYGLYGHESGQLPPSATTATGEPATTTTTLYNTESEQPVHKYLPKNYNPVAYVTQPEGITDSTTFPEEKSYTTNPNNNNNNNNNNYYNGAQNYYNSQQQEETEYRSYPTTANNRDNTNYKYNGGSSFNSQPQGLSDTRFSGGATLSSRERYFNNGGEGNGFQPQGMSDTRFLENGKYFYNVNTEKYSSNHPYESLRGVRARNEYNNRNYYGNSENNAFEFNSENSMGGYQNQKEFQDEENNMP